MVNFKPEFLELLNRTEKCTINRLNKLMATERANYKREQEQLKKNAEQTVASFITYIRNGRKVALINEKPAIGEKRTLKFKSYSTGLMTYNLPEDLQWELDVDMYAVIDPSTKSVVGMATRRVNSTNGIQPFHSNGNSTCFGTSFRAVNQANVQKAYDKLTETLEVVNVDSLLGVEEFLTPISSYAQREREISRRLDQAQSRGQETVRCIACDQDVPVAEFRQHYEEHYECPICHIRYAHEDQKRDCEISCARDKENHQNYQRQARGENNEQE